MTYLKALHDGNPAAFWFCVAVAGLFAAAFLLPQLHDKDFDEQMERYDRELDRIEHESRLVQIAQLERMMQR